MRLFYCAVKNCQVPAVNGSAPGNMCPTCRGVTVWRTEPWPRYPYEVTFNDRRFLRSLRIKADDEAIAVD